MTDRSSALNRRARTMVLVVALQALAAAFFIVDVIADIAVEGIDAHLLMECAAVLALFVGILAGALQIRDLLARARQDEMAVATARGALADLVRLRFEQWQLTPAEADVALFALKGFDIAEIARLRGAAAGTVRAQLARVYAKADAKSQAGLIALFVEDLIEIPSPSGSSAGA